jgi:FkbM family methyltransferase
MNNKVTEEGIYNIYEQLLSRSPNPDEIAHWLATEANTDGVEEELLRSFEIWQKNNHKFRTLVTMPGFKMYAMSNDYSIGGHIIRSKSFESHVAKAIKRNLKAGDVFLDLGANIGFFTLLAASIVQESGKVISVEPNIQNVQLLYASILENQFNNIKVFPFAASNCSQILNLTSFGSNGLVRRPEVFQPNSQFIQSVIIDDLLENETKISLVKIDIEGYEPLALRGMDKTIRKFYPVIISEFNPWHIERGSQTSPIDYLRQLSQYGYSFQILESSGEIINDMDTDSIMNYWEKFDNEAHSFDLLAYKNGQ